MSAVNRNGPRAARVLAIVAATVVAATGPLAGAAAVPSTTRVPTAPSATGTVLPMAASRASLSVARRAEAGAIVPAVVSSSLPRGVSG